MARKSTRKVGTLFTRRFLNFGDTAGNEAYKYKSNFIKTSKYNILTFFPKSILLQFERYANIYFLFTAIFQSIPQISPLHPFSAIAPFVFVIALAVLREGYEDYLRHVSDKELNANNCTVHRDGRFVTEQWRQLQVGDIVKVDDMEFFPADLVVLVSSNSNAMCYIETASLDGEKNLKPKVAPKETSENSDSDHPAAKLRGTIQCDNPNPELYQYEGVLTTGDSLKISLGPKQLLLRGARLKNTEWVVGVVCYTGDDTKIMKNAESSKFKQSNVERVVNQCILSILLIELLLCLLCAVANFVWNTTSLDGDEHHEVYLMKIYGNGTQASLTYFSYFLLFNTMIPISLVVSLEFVKLIQAYFIRKDIELYSEEKNRFANVSTSSIIEELGQVDYVFSDKTGTLTCNRMEFQQCVIGNTNYAEQDVNRLLSDSSSSKLQKQPTSNETARDKPEQGGVNMSVEDLDLSRSKDDISLQVSGSSDYYIKGQKELAEEFLKCLALCHDCLLEKTKDGTFEYQVSTSSF